MTPGHTVGTVAGEDRRAFFTRMFWGLAGLLSALVGIPVLGAFLSPAFRPAAKAQWIAVGPADTFGEGKHSTRHA